MYFKEGQRYILRFVYWLQALASILWKMVTRPFYVILWIRRDKRSRAGVHEKAFYVFQSERSGDMLLRWCLYKIINIENLLSGVRSSDEVAGILAVSREGTRFLGFKTYKVSSFYGFLGNKDIEGRQAVDCMWKPSISLHGEFVVRNIVEIGEDEVAAECLWITGENSGKRFTLGSSINHVKQDLNKDSTVSYRPSFIYLQPNWVTLIVQVLAIIGFARLIEYGKKFLSWAQQYVS